MSESYDQKPTNPKDVIGSRKLPVHLVPDSVTVYAALAFLEGALKYGRFNWRISGVRFMIYTDAIERHLKKLKNGEWADPVTRVPHLASIIACAGIILDAKDCGKLNDDRPPVHPTSEIIDGLTSHVEHLKDLFAEHKPYQYTIEDSVYGNERTDPGILRQVPRDTESEEATRRSQQGSSRGGERREGVEGRWEGGGSQGCIIERRFEREVEPKNSYSQDKPFIPSGR
jgi:hypothetical protein